MFTKKEIIRLSILCSFMSYGFLSLVFKIIKILKNAFF